MRVPEPCGKIVSCDAGHRGDRYRPGIVRAVECAPMGSGTFARGHLAIAIALAAVTLPLTAEAQRGPGGPPPRSPRSAAPVDLTGQWVSLITEEWRQRQFTGAKGDFGSLNVVLLPPARKIAASWDPARDAA